jgi:hypothetical protein
MLLHLNGEYWSKQRMYNAPVGNNFLLTEAEIANVLWDLVRLTFRIGVDEGRPVGYFSFPQVDLSPRLLNVSYMVMTKSYFTTSFAVGTHARLGNASPVLALAHAPELVAMIERFLM